VNVLLIIISVGLKPWAVLRRSLIVQGQNPLIMKSALLVLSIFIGVGPLLVIRHDVDDSAYQEFGKQFAESVCYLNLREDTPDGHGTVIDSNWVLTAAHCAVEIQEKLEDDEVHLITFAGVDYQIEEVILHPEWMENEAFDIALVKLDRPVKKGDIIPVYRGENELDREVIVVGKGDIGTGKTGIQGNDGHLRAGTNRVEQATDYWLKWTFDDPAEQPERVTRLEGISGPGDSGGPAFMEVGDSLFVVGISSAQSTRNSGGVEGVYGVLEYYTRVSRYADWIDDNMKK